MNPFHATQLAGSKATVLTELRQAATVLLERNGRPGTFDELPFLAAASGGFVVTHRSSHIPCALPRQDGGRWDTPKGADGDSVQHVIEIRIGKQLVGLGWRGNGPIRTDNFVRGPWEFELLKAAGICITLPPGAIRPVAAAPYSKSRWSMVADFDFSLFARKLAQPLTFSIFGHFNSQTYCVQPGFSFKELRGIVAECFAEMQTADMQAVPGLGPASCFSLKCWNGDRLRDDGLPVGRPDFNYFIGSDDGLTTATALLLQFDIETRTKRPGRSRSQAPMPAPVDWAANRAA